MATDPASSQGSTRRGVGLGLAAISMVGGSVLYYKTPTEIVSSHSSEPVRLAGQLVERFQHGALQAPEGRRTRMTETSTVAETAGRLTAREAELSGLEQRLTGRSQQALDATQRALQATVDQVDRQMSTWKPDSTLNVLNRAPPGTNHAVPPELLTTAFM